MFGGWGSCWEDCKGISPVESFVPRVPRVVAERPRNLP